MLSLFSSEKPIDIFGPADYGKIAAGFFRIQHTKGKETLGYKPGSITIQERDEEGNVVSTYQVASPFGVMFDVKEAFNLGGQIIVLDVPKRKLPLIRFNFFNANSAGIARVGGTLVVNTEHVRQPDGFDFNTSDPAAPGDAGSRAWA